MRLQTLVLAPWMAPHRLSKWEEAITLVYCDKADVLETYEATVSSPSITLRIPAVVRLNKALSSERKDVKFSRANVYCRDGYRCQYCGNRLPPKQLNYDHVVPRCRGGKTDWLNVATACFPCNTKKGSKFLKQAGMKLLRQPFKPKSLPMSSSPILLPSPVPELWVPYLSDRLAQLQIA
jgi:5-methylcytosine-specific restriction endonuclease McrA